MLKPAEETPLTALRLAELVLDAGTGAVVYAVMVLMLNAAGVRDVARRLLARRQDAPA